MRRDQQIDDDDDFETIIGHDGQPVRILRSGRSLRVPLMLRDGEPFRMNDAYLTDLQRAVRDNARADDARRREQQQRIHDGTNNPYPLNRPGYRYSDAVDDSETVRAFDQMCEEQRNAWRKGPSDAASASLPKARYPLEPHRIGTACTENGEPGTLQVEGDWLVCRTSSRSGADSVPRSDMSDAEAIKQRAYDEMRAAQRDAWRHLRSA
jgi:hypothetical protein